MCSRCSDASARLTALAAARAVAPEGEGDNQGLGMRNVVVFFIQNDFHQIFHFTLREEGVKIVKTLV